MADVLHKVIRVVDDAKEFERQLNQVSKETKGFATQTHVVSAEGHVVFIATVFFKADDVGRTLK